MDIDHEILLLCRYVCVAVGDLFFFFFSVFICFGGSDLTMNGIGSPMCVHHVHFRQFPFSFSQGGSHLSRIVDRASASPLPFPLSLCLI